MGSSEGSTVFHAGPLEALYAGGDLRYLRVGGVEVLRRIYVGVRDGAWGTIPGVIRDLSHQQDENGFHIAYAAEHRAGEIAFQWRAVIEGRAKRCGHGGVDADISFTMDGEALSTFKTNRTGFCVLHPIDGCAGRECVVERPDGSTERGAFPRLIASHQPLKNIRAMRYEPAAGLQVEVRFEGDVFELEDQRNWTDGSYKTYCRPLSLPFPYELQKGQRVRQVVRVRVTGKTPSAGGAARELVIGRRVGVLPRIGLRLPKDRQALNERQIQRIRSLNLSHLRADLHLSEADAGTELTRAARESAALEVPLEMGIHVSAEAEKELGWLKEELSRHRLTAARWLVYREREPMVAGRYVELARKYLQEFATTVPVGGGTIGNFAELNRSRAVQGMQVLAYPVNPQIHAMDDWSVMENLQGQADTVATARAFAPGAMLAVGPVMLHRRPDPFAAGNSGVEESVSGDPRQTTLFGAAWTAGSIKHLSEAGADSITCYETVGEFGAMEGEHVFPLYHVLADVSEFAGGDVLTVKSSEPLAVEGLALRSGGRMRVMVANLTAAEQRVKVKGLRGEWRVKVLDERSVEEAKSQAEAYRAKQGERVRGSEDGLELRLEAYAVARLDGNVA